MLTELHIENFALIDTLTVEFAPGLNILTGETGAGKSIVIDAINVLLGERAGTDLVRTGAERAVLQAVFDVSDVPHLLPELAEIGAEPEDGLIILSREVAREGRNVARLNGRTCPVSVVRQVGDMLVDLHGQHEHQSLLREEFHLAFLDALGDDAFARAKAEVAALAKERAGLLRELRDLQSDERERLRTIDLLAFQVEEIEKADLTPGEEEELTAERMRLANAEKLHAAAEAAYGLLYDSDEGRSVLDALGEAEMQLAGLTHFDPDLATWADTLRDASVQITEVCRELAAYRDRTQFDPERLEEVEQRLMLLGTLKRKYGESIDAILAYGAEKRAALDRLNNSEERIDEVKLEIARVERRLAERALALSALRRALAERLTGSVQEELTHLGMPSAVFRVDLARRPKADGLPVDGETVEVTAQGIDNVAFQISANPGEPPKPLVKVASGGEMSRIMLALKAVAARGSGVPTLIFDEIDSGIGGRTAEAVGEKLSQVARAMQVICVTHLAQIAFHADKHFVIEKETDGEHTISRMREAVADARIAELARLQAGGRITDAVLGHIREVLDEVNAAKSGTLF